MANLEAMARAWATEHYGEAHKLSDTEIGWLVAFAAKVDAEATERAAMVCMERRELFYKAREAHPANGKYWNIAHLSAGEADCCFHAIRSTLARKEADHAEG